MSDLHDMPITDRYLKKAGVVSVCLKPIELLEDALTKGECALGKNGQVCVITTDSQGVPFSVGRYYTGDDIFHHRQLMTHAQYTRVCDLASGYVRGKHLYVVDFCAAGTKFRFITEFATQALAATNVFRTVWEPHHAPDTVILSLPGAVEDDDLGLEHNRLSIIDLAGSKIMINGTSDFKEVKDAVFEYLCHKLQKQGAVPLHAVVGMHDQGSLTAQEELQKQPSVFFCDPSAPRFKRPLITNGVECHVWTSQGIENLDGGCYTNVLNISQEANPEKWMAANRICTVIENADINEERDIDFSSPLLTSHVRASFSAPRCPTLPHPKNIVFFINDELGVVPSVSCLDRGAQQYFVSKLLKRDEALYGTDIDLLTSLLLTAVQTGDVRVWIVNTGRVGDDKQGVQLASKDVWSIVVSILKGDINELPLERFAELGVDVPSQHFKHTIPTIYWSSKDEYSDALKKLLP